MTFYELRSAITEVETESKISHIVLDKQSGGVNVVYKSGIIRTFADFPSTVSAFMEHSKPLEFHGKVYFVASRNPSDDD